MANSLDNVKRESQSTFVDQLAEGTEDYLRCCNPISDPGATARVMTTNAGGDATEVSSGTTSVSARDLTSGITTVTQQAWVIKHTMPWAQLNWSLNLAADVGAQLANAMSAKINGLYFEALEAALTTAHPMVGAGAGEVGLGQNFIDTNQQFAQTTADVGGQSNKQTAALAEATLKIALNQMRKWKNQQAVVQNLGDYRDLTLVVGATNEFLARELVGSALSGSDMQVNTLQGVADVVTFGGLADEDDWFLVNKRLSPVNLWIGEAPTMSVSESEDKIFVHFVAKAQATGYFKPSSAGLCGSNVA